MSQEQAMLAKKQMEKSDALIYTGPEYVIISDGYGHIKIDHRGNRQHVGFCFPWCTHNRKEITLCPQ